MKRHVLLAFGALLLLQPILLAHALPVSAAGPNLIVNPSFETGGDSPNGWVANKWGSLNAQITYKKNGGYNSARSGYVNVSNYQSGDAKWYFAPVNVQPNTDYTFSDFYRSNVKTHLVAISLDAQGNPTYFDVARDMAASSVNWKQSTGKVKTLANTTKLSIFHIIDRNGWLQTDAASLTADTVTPPPPPVNLAPNPSVEQVSADPAKPTGWQNNNWGANTANFEYPNEGHTGNKSVKVSVSNYQDGDAKWFFEPIVLERGKDFKFSAWYKTNTLPHVVARYIQDDNTERYFGLPRPEPNGSSNWQQYADTFYVPPNVKAVSVFFYVASNGYVQTDDYSITPHQVSGFTRPLVSMTFDDGFEGNVATVLPKLSAHGFKSTQCYATSFIEGIPEQEANVRTFRDNGHEICSHTVNHPDLTALSPAGLTFELTHSQNYLKNLTGTPVTTFSSPFGAYNAAVNNEIKQYYRSHRTTNEGYNSKDNFSSYRIRVQNMQSATTLAEYQGWLNKAKADKTWLVLVYHRVTNDNPGQFDTKEDDFVQQLNTLSASGVTVKTYNAALDEIGPQL